MCTNLSNILFDLELSCAGIVFIVSCFSFQLFFVACTKNNKNRVQSYKLNVAKIKFKPDLQLSDHAMIIIYLLFLKKKLAS